MSNRVTRSGSGLDDAALGKAIAAAVGSGIAVVDEAGRTIHVNDAFCRMVGWPRDELVGADPPFCYWPEAHRAEIADAFRRTLAGQLPPQGWPLTFQRQGGELFPVLLFIAPLLQDGVARGWVANVVDLSVQAAQAAALRESEERLQAAQEGAGVGVWDWDLLTDETYWSATVARLYGLPGETVVDYRAWRRQVPPGDLARIEAAVQEAIAGQQPFEVEFPVVVASGETRWLLSKGRARYDAEGRAVRVLGVNLDVTERRRTEQALAAARANEARFESERRLGALLRQSVAGIAEAALDGHLLEVNERMCELTGYTRAELLERSLRDITPAEDMPLVDGTMRAILHGDRAPVTIEKRYRRKDGRIVWVSSSPTLLYDDNGRPDRFYSVVLDVTARKQQEQELERMRLLMAEGERIAGLGSWEYLAATGETVWSEGECRIYGVDPVQKSPDYARLLHERIHPDDAALLDRTFRDAMQRRAPFELEHRIVRPDGSVRWVRDLGYPSFDDAGQVVRYVGSTLDITGQRSTEQALRELTQTLEAKVAERTAQLEAASAAKSVFLANMSHEIRTPLNAILGMAQLLEQKAGDAEDQDSARRIRDAGEILLRSLNDILDLSKIEAGHLEIERRPFCIAKVVADVESIAASMAAGKGLALRIDTAAAADLQLGGDAMRVEQVLLNLLSNAVKFTAAGEIALRVTVRDVSAAAVRLRFEVRDTGIGVPAAKLATLFTPFTQADAGITRRFGGTGLGLAISKRLVELMGGVIGVESIEGGGSEFWFELPFDLVAVPPAGQPGEVRAVPPPAGTGDVPLHGLRVLVVDDSRMNLEVVDRLLRRDGAVVTLADGASGALALLRAEPQDFDVVLMDVQMPGMDGLTATREIRRDPVLGRMPVIALTAGVMPEERAAAAAAGMDDLLPKPLDLKEMRAMLARYRTVASAA